MTYRYCTVRLKTNIISVCYECESGQEWKGNLILLCDGPGCERAYHMGCLHPPMLRQPAHHREWFCPRCKEKSARPTSSRGTPGSGGQRRAASPVPAISPYEQQRLNNIARNQQRLRELGLA